MAQDVLSLFFTPSAMIELAVFTVVSGMILFLTSRLVGAKGGLLSAISVGFINSLLLVFLYQAYVFPLLEVDSADILTSLKTNVLGLVLSYALPAVTWFVVVMVVMRVGPVQAGIIAFVQWILRLALVHFGVMVFLTQFL